MITQELLDSLGDRKIYAMETRDYKDVFIATGGSLKRGVIFFLVTLVCTRGRSKENFYIGKGLDETSPFSGLYVDKECTIRKPTLQEFLNFSKVMKDNKIAYNKKTKEVKKL